MISRKIARKAKVGASVIKNEGLLSFSIKSLQIIQASSRRRTLKGRTHELDIRAHYQDIIAVNLKKPLQPWTGTNKKTLTFNWIMSQPGKGSGGHMNIFRFIKYLEKAGHKNRIYLYARGGKGTVDHIWASMGDSYPSINAEMQWLEEGKEMAAADGIFATSWETAYPAFVSKLVARRFYFVQDYEPYFFPVGSLYSLAENTYNFGFYGITAGGWLAQKLKKENNMKTDYFDFGSDENLYSYMNDQRRKEIFFYARPYTERRGFETGIMALDLFHQKHPDYIINLAGWDVSNYKIPFPYRNLCTLELSKLNLLYNQCAAGLVMSFTNMSLLPLELLGSGAIPVVNDGENNRLVSDNKYIAYSPGDPRALAEKLSEVVNINDLPKYAEKASKSVVSNSWDDSGSKFVKIVERETRNHE